MLSSGTSPNAFICLSLPGKLQLPTVISIKLPAQSWPARLFQPREAEGCDAPRDGTEHSGPSVPRRERPFPPQAGEGLHGLVSTDRPTAAGQDKTTRSVISCACSGPAGSALRAQVGLFHGRVAADARLSLPQPQPQALPAPRGTDDPELVLRLTNEARPPPFPKVFEPRSGGGVGFGAVLLKVTDVPPRPQRALPRCRRGGTSPPQPPPGPCQPPRCCPGRGKPRGATGGPPGPGSGAVPA